MVSKKEYRLGIELVPKPLWYVNVRKALTPEAWDRIKMLSRKAAGNKCEICSQTGLEQGYT